MLAKASPRALPTVVALADELAGGLLTDVGPRVPTFREVGEQWTAGELHRKHPDQIKLKRSAGHDAARLSRYVYPVMGATPINQVTLDQCELVMATLPATMRPATRRNVGQLMTKLMKMAVYPLRHIRESPIPPGFLPSAKKPRALAYLYPDEEARLLACEAVPLAHRMLWGFLTREGVRKGEALALTWAALDLKRGAVRLDKNKTDDPRAWALNDSVVRALRVYREQHRPDAPLSALVFTDDHGKPFTAAGAVGLAPTLREHLKLIGLDKERPELFESTEERQRIRVHDLRGTFVTVSLANGRSESWIADRTGQALVARRWVPLGS